MRTFKHMITVAALLTTGLGAQGVAAELKIGYVNAARLLEEAPQAESASEELKQEFSVRESDLVSQRREIQRLEERLSRDGDIMSEQEREQLERQLLQAQRKLRRNQQDFREDLNMRRNEKLGRLQERVQQAIETVGQEQGFDIILFDGIAFAAAEYDVTEQVLRHLTSGDAEDGGD